MRKFVSWGLRQERRPRARGGGIAFIPGEESLLGVMECWVRVADVSLSDSHTNSDWLAVAAVGLC